ncbi:uncharacterized protein LOC134442436, partial [Engraulis encrasicolus]|uniref:uncharacterized protein LOC134442436 n=1 Tax=Engraulis encrasicolus TaxID=184585 RepID=UPI002FD42CC4
MAEIGVLSHIDNEKIERRRRGRINPVQDAQLWINAHRDKSGFEVKFINSWKGRGIFATVPFEKGNFLLEYRGDFITIEECQRRQRFYHDNRKVFMFEFRFDGKIWCIDAATEDGSFGRLVNDDHINSNAKIKCLNLQGKPHLCLFATRDIRSGEEITYNYGDSDWPWRSKGECSTPSVKEVIGAVGVRQESSVENNAAIASESQPRSECQSSTTTPDITACESVTPSAKEVIGDIGVRQESATLFSTDGSIESQPISECQSSTTTADITTSEVECSTPSAKEVIGAVGVRQESSVENNAAIASESQPRSECQSSTTTPDITACESVTPSAKEVIGDIGVRQESATLFSTDGSIESQPISECQSSTTTADITTSEVECSTPSAKEVIGAVGVRQESSVENNAAIASESQPRSECQSSTTTPDITACESVTPSAKEVIGDIGVRQESATLFSTDGSIESQPISECQSSTTTADITTSEVECSTPSAKEVIGAVGVRQESSVENNAAIASESQPISECQSSTTTADITTSEVECSTPSAKEVIGAVGVRQESSVENNAVIASESQPISECQSSTTTPDITTSEVECSTPSVKEVIGAVGVRQESSVENNAAIASESQPRIECQSSTTTPDITTCE